MAETFRIEIPITVDDNTEPGVSTAKSKLTAFDKSNEKVQDRLDKMNSTKWKIALELKDSVGPALTTLGTNLKNVTGKAWSVTMKAVDLVTSPVRGIINLLKNPIFQAATVLGISVSFTDVVETYEDFEAAMSEVQAISGATSDELDKLTAKAKEMGSTTKFTAEEAAEAFTYMGMAGWSASEMMDGIEGILNLAAASGEELADVSDIVTDALTAFGLQASDAGHFSDVLATAASSANTTVSGMGETFKYAAAMAGTLGYSIEDVALMTGLMANNGIKGTMAGTALNSIFTRLSTNTGNATDALTELGIEFFDSTGNARDLSDVMEELRAATANMNDEEKSALANTIAGTEAQKGLLAILNATEDDYNSLADAINNADGAAESMADTMLDNLSGAITLLQSAVDGVKLSMGERIAPYIREAAEWLTDQMGTIEEISEEFFDWLDAKVEDIRKKFADISLTEEWQNANLFGKAKILWDSFIVEPFSEWWGTTGKAKCAEIANTIGDAIGSGLKWGILTLLGIDIGDSVDEGASVGRSFAQGFSEGFDFDLISSKLSEGFKNLLSNAGSLLTGDVGISSVISAAILAKMASTIAPVISGTYGVGKAIFGSSESLGGWSLAQTALGSTGNAMVNGSGLLGGLANVGYGLTGGAATSTLGGGTAALLGAGSIAGGIAAGATVISAGKDIYTAATSDDAEAKSTYASSAGLKLGGVAAGAATGALIGSVIPGIGTAVGALVGAGIGGIGGWIAGNSVKKEYEEAVEEAKEQAELAQKCYEATGLSIDQVSFKNESLNEALQDTELTATDLANMIKKDVAARLDEAFGDITLSLSEIQDIADEIVFDGATESVAEFQSAVSDVESSVSTLQSAVTALKKQNWKVSLGMELSESEQDEYRSAIDTFVASAQEYIENEHYQATVALSLITDGTGDTTNLDAVYNDLKQQIDDISDQLADEMEIALEDGVITLDESAELLSLQEQITEITNKLLEAEQEASLETLKIKYTNGAELDADSWAQLQSEIQSQMEEYQASYDEALTISITNLKLQLSEGAITQEEYDAALEELTADYVAHINEMSARIESFNLDTIADAWSEELDGILPDIEGTTKEKLETALNNALLSNPDVDTWTAEDVMGWFGLEDLANSDYSAFENIFEELVTTAQSVGEATKDDILQSYQDAVPTAEEIKEAIDWDSMTVGDWQELMESITGPAEGESIGVSSEHVNELMSEYYGDYFEKVKESYSEALQKALTEAQDEETLADFLEQYFTDTTSEFDFTSIMQNYGPISNEYYAELVAEWSQAGTELGDSLNSGTSGSLLGASTLYRSSALTALQEAFSDPFSVTATINVTGNYNLLNTFNASSSVTQHAWGGLMNTPHVGMVAEDGPEAIIPLSPSKSERGLDLWRKAGQYLGVQAYADGDIVGDVSDVTTETTAGASGNNSFDIKVEVNPSFQIDGKEGMDEEAVVAIIKARIREMADDIGDELAERLARIFANMPAKGVA